MVGETPSFQVPFTSPVDGQLVELTCVSSAEALGRADCSGSYTTVPKGVGTEGFEVRIACEIPLGAVSGPGCRTTVLEGIGPTIDKVYNQYLEPTCLLPR